ncbi:MAG: hypothetical protein M1829_006189 [Trizodia sp. TS-e1964]|nr:MAG: hypothetical protein M1829_006189 [Trizodia sp. TS-e1964]
MPSFKARSPVVIPALKKTHASKLNHSEHGLRKKSDDKEAAIASLNSYIDELEDQLSQALLAKEAAESSLKVVLNHVIPPPRGENTPLARQKINPHRSSRRDRAIRARFHQGFTAKDISSDSNIESAKDSLFSTPALRPRFDQATVIEEASTPPSSFDSQSSSSLVDLIDYSIPPTLSKIIPTLSAQSPSLPRATISEDCDLVVFSDIERHCASTQNQGQGPQSSTIQYASFETPIYMFGDSPNKKTEGGSIEVAVVETDHEQQSPTSKEPTTVYYDVRPLPRWGESKDISVFSESCQAPAPSIKWAPERVSSGREGYPPTFAPRAPRSFLNFRNQSDETSARFFTFGISYQPHKLETNTLRAIIISNIPPAAKISDVLALVRGGAITSATLVDTRKLTAANKNSAIVNFLEESAATAYDDFAHQNALSFTCGTVARVTLLRSPTWPLLPEIREKMLHAEHSRCLKLTNLPRDFRLALFEWDLGWLHMNIESTDHREADNELYLNFTTVIAAMKAKDLIKFNARHPDMYVAFVTDPCTRSLAELTKSK